MKKLVICGDSFMSALSYDPQDLDNGFDKHFTEILGRKLDWEVVTFARAACGNQTIRLQIEEAIRTKPDCVIIGLTSPDRFEFPIGDLTVDSYFNKYLPENREKMYQKDDLLKNINYKGFPDKSSEHILFNDSYPKMLSETLNNIFWNDNHEKHFNQSEVKILLDWFNRFYDVNWKNQQDSWIIQGGLKKLTDENINFYCVNPMLYPHEFECFGNKMILHDSPLNPWNYNGVKENVKYRFHTSLENQEVLAELWYNRFQNDNII
jgi:hypothetical protein